MSAESARQLLDGRGGNDTLTGGAGNDTFVYADGDGADVITDFVAGASSPDRIDLTGVSSVHSLADILDDFIFAANQAPTNVALSDDTVPANSSAGTVNGTVHADADAEMQIHMSHPYMLTASDFVL